MLDTIESLLLRRDHLVSVRSQNDSSTSGTFVEFEYALLKLGFVASAGLQKRLRALSGGDLLSESQWILETLKADLGADVSYIPLFRSFPDNIPEDTYGLYVIRMASYLFQNPDQPCLFCNKTDTVMALDPCGHLVCSSCWDGANYSACPICNRRIALDSPFLKPARFLPPENPDDSAPLTLKLLHLCSDKDAAARKCFKQLVSRQIVLSQSDLSDLVTLTSFYQMQAIEWLPEKITLKENMATVFGTVLKVAPASADAIFDAATPYLRGATDLLRLIAVLMDGPPSLREYPESMKSFTRQVRRRILALIESFNLEQAIDNMLRRKSYWKAVGERLHVFESHKKFPRAACAFAVLRHTRLDFDTALGASLMQVVSENPDCLSLNATSNSKGLVLSFQTWAARLEIALRAADLPRALDLIGERPGEFLRKLDWLYRKILRSDPDLTERLVHMFSRHLGKAPAQILLTLLPHLRTRINILSRRVFFPHGNVARAFVRPDFRDALPEEGTRQLLAGIEAELLKRAARGEPFKRVVIDLDIKGLLLPFQERTASKALLSVPRGSLLPITGSGKFRLFLHWMQPEKQRVDLDLSLALFDEEWQPAGRCDYTSLRFADSAAIHSGDLTSAPPPLGAAEFVDLDSAGLLANGIRYAVMMVFSYTRINFEELPEAFAGIMDHHGRSSEVFDPRKVEQRFDLAGASQIAAPMILDLKNQTMLWIDMCLPPVGLFRNVRSNQNSIAYLGLYLSSYFAAGARMNMWEAACLQAAACTGDIQVRMAEGMVARYIKGTNEKAADFYRRVVLLSEPDAMFEDVEPGTEPLLMFAMRDYVPVPDGSRVYALKWQELWAERVHRLAAGDLLNAFAASAVQPALKTGEQGNET